jgi:hypothetical protein
MANEQVTVVVVEAVEQKYTPGDRGVVGEATAALKIKNLWHETHFKLVDDDNPFNPNHRVWTPNNSNVPSLKRFARGLAASGDQVAKDWLDHKHGSLNQARTDANIKAAHEAASATHLEKRKKSEKNRSKSKTSSEAPAALPNKGK